MERLTLFGNKRGQLRASASKLLRRSLVALLLAVTLGGCIVGCSSTSKDGDTNDSGNAASADSQALLDAVMEGSATLYDTVAEKELLLDDWLGSAECMVGTYTLVDLNGDGDNEAVLQLSRIGADNEFFGVLILHAEDGTVYAYEMPYRGFNEPKTDGSFSYAGGAFDHGIARFEFEGKVCTMLPLAYCEWTEDEGELYFIDDKAVSEEEFNAYYDEFLSKPDLDWHTFDKGN